MITMMMMTGIKQEYVKQVLLFIINIIAFIVTLYNVFINLLNNLQILKITHQVENHS